MKKKTSRTIISVVPTIEKGIPIPEPNPSGPAKGQSKFPLAKMEVGDSFWYPNRVSVISTVSRFKKSSPEHTSKQFTTRADGKGWRIWRTK